MKFRFHSLQSLYDTHVSETEVEGLDAGLLILRGHVSVVYHLLEIATQMVHYYERHLNIDTGDSSLRRKPVIALQTLLTMLMNYAIAFAGLLPQSGTIPVVHHAQTVCRSGKGYGTCSLLPRTTCPTGHSDRENRAPLRQRHTHGVG